VRDGALHTPPLGASALPGITRSTVMTLARELAIPVTESEIPREMLYIADEAFLSGTAAEITPIRSVDRITVGKGHRGPITEKLQNAFFAILDGSQPDTHGWLSPVEVRQPVAAK
jgi:branched-chain amino acid aminotransferase